jgi:hypothetical protein
MGDTQGWKMRGKINPNLSASWRPVYGSEETPLIPVVTLQDLEGLKDRGYMGKAITVVGDRFLMLN